MTIGELRELIEGIDDNVEVRWAAQPSWPMEYRIADGVLDEEDPAEVFYLVEGYQIGYLPSGIQDIIGW